MTTLKNKKSNKRFRKTRSKRGGIYNPFTGEDYNIRKKAYKAIRSATGHKTQIYQDDEPNEHIQNTPIENMENQQQGGKRKTRKTKKSNKRFRKTRSKRQNGGDNVNAKDANGCTALIRASWDGDTEIVAMLLAKGADVNAKDAKGSTALMKASLNGHTKVVSMLLEKGADVNAKDNNGSTALMKATLHRHTEIVRMLLEKGVDVNVKTGYGSTALVLASWDGETEIVRMLLENGADVNAKDADGSTALIKASLNGHTKVVSMLLEKGADVNAKNNAGNTAFFLANRRVLENRPGYKEIVKLLIQSIAAQTFLPHLERQKNRGNLAMVMSEKPVNRNVGEHRMPPEMEYETMKFLGGKRRTRKSRK